MSYGEGSNGAVSFKITNPAASSSASTSSRTQPVASTSSGSQHHHNRAQHSRHHRPHQRYRSDSEESEDEDGHGFQRRRAKDESIVGIDDRGIKTSSSSRKERPLVIQSAPNKDFRRAAMELRAKKEGRQQFVPGQERDDGKAKRVLTDAERRFLESGSNVQRTGDRVMTGGIRQRQSPANGQSGGVEMEAGDKTPVMRPSGLSTMPDLDTLTPAVDADTLALRELLQDQNEEEHQTKVHVIPQVDSAVTEEEAYAIDVASRPDTPDLEAYQRVPIEDFGAALLRGMGGGSKKPRPKVEAWVPKARTALLGIGAKSREETFGADWVAQQDGAKKGSNKREQMKFMPLQRVERAPSSGSASPAPRPVENGRSEEISSSRRKRDEEDRYALEEVDGRHRKSRRRSYEGSDKEDGSRHRDSRHRERSRSPRSDKRDRERHRDLDSRAHRDDSNRDRYSKDRDWPRDRDGNRTRERDRESSKLREREDYRSREPWQ